MSTLDACSPLRAANPAPAGPPPGPVEVPGRRVAVGIAYVAASALCFGSMSVLARAAYASGVDTSTLLFLRFSFAAPVLWTILAARRAPLPRGRALGVLVAMGAVGYAGQAFSFFTALTYASAGLVALLLYLYPAMVALLARLVFHHPLTRTQLAAIAIAIAGSVLTIGRAGDGKPLGVLFGVLAAVIYACYIQAGSRLPRAVSPTASAAVVITSAAVVYAAVTAVRGARLPATAQGWAAVSAIALVCTVLAITFFFAGLERVGPVRASIYSTLEPAFTLALAAVVLGERLTLLRVAGGGLILAAVIVLARAEAASTAAGRPG